VIEINKELLSYAMCDPCTDVFKKRINTVDYCSGQLNNLTYMYIPIM